MSSESGPFKSPGWLFQASTLGFSLFFRKDRLLALLRVQLVPGTRTSSFAVKGGTNTDRTSGVREERLFAPRFWAI